MSLNILLFLHQHNFFDIAWYQEQKMISFGLVQPNGYAHINKDEVLLSYDSDQLQVIDKILQQCYKYGIEPDFHYTAPPICILWYQQYNLEYKRLKLVTQDEKNGKLNKSNLESFRWLWKEKRKIPECKKCEHNSYCLWFYKNWIDFMWEEKVRERVQVFLQS